MFRKNRLPFPALALIPAAALLLCTLLIPMGRAARLILCLLSFLASFYPLALPMWREVVKKRLPGYPLLLTAACLLYLFAGRPCGGAAAMLVYRLALPLLEWQRDRAVRVVTRRRELTDLGELMGDYVPDPGPGDGPGRFLRRWLTYILLALAAVVVILLMLLTRMSTTLVLRRAAMILALGNLLPLFFSYGICDYAACVNACEQGVLFRGDSMARLNGAKLCCIVPPAVIRRGNALIQSALPQEIPPAALLELAACAWSCSPSHLGDTLAELLGRRTDPELLERYQELRDYGVLARIKGRVVICGSAEFMHRAGLPVTPFKDREDTVHVGIEGRYAGCIRLNQADAGEEELTALVKDCGLYRFGDAEAAAEHDPDETLLYASGDGQRGPAGETDVYASLGGSGEDPEVAAAPGGIRGAVLVLGALLNSKRSRALCFFPALALKALLLIAALIGLCPIWIAVLAEAVVASVCCAVARQALNAKL